MDAKNALRFVDKLQLKYDKPTVFHMDANQISEHCVGGILVKDSRSLWRKFSDFVLNRDLWGFPSEIDIADALRKHNPKLTEEKSLYFASHIIENNDHKEFGWARDAIASALTWSEPSSWEIRRQKRNETTCSC